MIITLGGMAEVDTGALGHAKVVPAPLVPAAALSDACGIATIVTVLSLGALHRYVVAFGLRCGCAGFGLLLANQSTAIAAERTAHVVPSGIIGIAFVPIIRAIAGAFQPARNHHDIIRT